MHDRYGTIKVDGKQRAVVNVYTTGPEVGATVMGFDLDQNTVAGADLGSDGEYVDLRGVTATISRRGERRKCAVSGTGLDALVRRLDAIKAARVKRPPVPDPPDRGYVTVGDAGIRSPVAITPRVGPAQVEAVKLALGICRSPGCMKIAGHDGDCS